MDTRSSEYETPSVESDVLSAIGEDSHVRMHGKNQNLLAAGAGEGQRHGERMKRRHHLLYIVHDRKARREGGRERGRD